MALETGETINSLVSTNPPAGDPVAEGDNHLRLIKKTVQQSFPSVNQGSNPIIASTTAPSLIVADGAAYVGSKGSQGLVWHDLTTNTLKINKSTTAVADWVTLAVSPLTSNSVDVNAGTVDGAVIGGVTPAAITGTTLTGNTSLALATGATVTGVDNGALGSSATLLATQGAIKTYVDAQITAEDLDFQGDSGTGAIDLDSQTLDIAGGASITTTASGQTLTVAADDATTAVKGVASFDTNHFDVTAGAVSIQADSIDDTLIDFGTGANQVSTADVPEQTNLYYTDVRADARIAAADIGDLNNVNTAGLADNDILKYDSATSSFVAEPDRIANHLTTKGDLLGFSTTETRVPVGINGTVLTADSTGTYGVAWTAGGDAVGTAAAMAIALG